MYWPIITVNFANAMMPTMNTFPLNYITLVFLLSQRTIYSTYLKRFQRSIKINREGEWRYISFFCAIFLFYLLPTEDRKEIEKLVGCIEFA